MPLVCDPLEATVDADELDACEDTEEDELDRDKGFRGANMPTLPRASSGFIE